MYSDDDSRISKELLKKFQFIETKAQFTIRDIGWLCDEPVDRRTNGKMGEQTRIGRWTLLIGRRDSMDLFVQFESLPSRDAVDDRFRRTLHVLTGVIVG